MQIISLGSAPRTATAISINDPEYTVLVYESAVAFIGQIRRHYGLPPRGAGLYISKSEIRGIGHTADVTLTYNSSDDVAFAYALAILLDPKLALSEWDEAPKRQPIIKQATAWNGIARAENPRLIAIAA